MPVPLKAEDSFSDLHVLKRTSLYHLLPCLYPQSGKGKENSFLASHLLSKTLITSMLSLLSYNLKKSTNGQLVLLSIEKHLLRFFSIYFY